MVQSDECFGRLIVWLTTPRARSQIITWLLVDLLLELDRVAMRVIFGCTDMDGARYIY